MVLAAIIVTVDELVVCNAHIVLKVCVVKDTSLAHVLLSPAGPLAALLPAHLSPIPQERGVWQPAPASCRRLLAPAPFSCPWPPVVVVVVLVVLLTLRLFVVLLLVARWGHFLLLPLLYLLLPGMSKTPEDEL